MNPVCEPLTLSPSDGGRFSLLLSRHEMAAAVCRRDGGVIIAHAHRALQGSIPVSQTFTACVFEVSAQEFSGQSVALSSLAPPMHSNRHLVARIHYFDLLENATSFANYFILQDKNSGIWRNRTATTPGIQLWSRACRLPIDSMYGSVLTWKKFWKHWSCGSRSLRFLCIKNHKLVPWRDNKLHWKKAQEHRVWWSLLYLRHEMAVGVDRRDGGNFTLHSDLKTAVRLLAPEDYLYSQRHVQ